MQLYNDDCFNIFPSIPDNSIDMVLADPPYGTTAAKWDTVLNFQLLWKELRRIAKPKTPIVLFATQPFTTLLISSNLKNYKYSWLWLKDRPIGHLVVKSRPMRRTEDILVFGFQTPNYYPQKILKDKPRTTKVYANTDLMPVNVNFNKDFRIVTHTYPTNVLEYTGVQPGKRLHPTQKPIELLQYLIKTYTQTNETVLDLCMGSGSTGEAAILEGRNFIGIEKDIDYFIKAQERLNNVKINND